jgi:Spy/CpxP family protein refolding chaperone
MKKIIFAVLMVAVLAIAGMAMALDWARGPGMGMGYGPHSGGPALAGPGLWGALNLTPEQVEKMHALRGSSFKEKIPLRNELMSKKLELKALWVQTNPDEEKILAKQKEINLLRAQLQEKTIKNRLEMRKILTPEQQAKLINFRGQQWPNRYHGYGRGRGFDRRPGYGRGMGYVPRW